MPSRRRSRPRSRSSSSSTASSSPRTATGCSARSTPRTPSRRRSSAPGARTIASRGGRRFARGSTGSRRTSASTCSRAGSGERGRWISARPARRSSRTCERRTSSGSSRCRTGASCPDGDPAEVVGARESVRLAFVAALQQLPPRQRAVLILCEVLRWKAAEVAELLETSVASVNSALQRARATLEASDATPATTAPSVDAADEELLERYVAAFEAYDMSALTALIHEDATQSMPPFDLWLSGREDILTWWFGPGNTCRDSRVVPAPSANGAPAFGQYRPKPDGDGLRAVGAAGRGDRERQDRRAHVLPRRRDRLSALRSPARVRRTPDTALRGRAGRVRRICSRRPPRPSRGPPRCARRGPGSCGCT